MRLLSELLIKPISAQSEADSVAQPTFFTDIDFSEAGGNNGGNNGGTEQGKGKITISTDDTNFVLDTEFEIDVDVDSDGEELTSYTVKIEYDADLVQVVDSDAALAGTQVDFTDTEFNETTNEVNTSAGTILIKGETATAKTKDGVVAKVKFITLAEGTAEVKVVEAESSLVNDASTNVLDSTNGLQIGVGDSIGEPGEIIDDPLTPQGVIQDIKDLPESGLPFSGVLYMALGVVLIAVGLRAKQISNKHKHS